MTWNFAEGCGVRRRRPDVLESQLQLCDLALDARSDDWPKVIFRGLVAGRRA